MVGLIEIVISLIRTWYYFLIFLTLRTYFEAHYIMEYIYKEPPLPSIDRLRRLYKGIPGESILRALEYESLADKDISGKVLDVGGGKKAKYVKHLPKGLEIDSINIDHSIEPTYIVQPGSSFPIEDNSYDNVICFNTLEHIYDSKFVLEEILRVLKPGGVAYITIPFMFRIHGHPDDYFRATPSWWKETARIVGFSRMELQPLIWGRYTATGLIGGYRGLLPVVLNKWLAHLKDILYAWLTFRNTSSYSGERGRRVCAIAPGYFICVSK